MLPPGLRVVLRPAADVVAGGEAGDQRASSPPEGRLGPVGTAVLTGGVYEDRVGMVPSP